MVEWKEADSGILDLFIEQSYRIYKEKEKEKENENNNK